MLARLKKLFTYDLVADPGFDIVSFNEEDGTILFEHRQKSREQRINTVLGIVDAELDRWIEDSTKLPFTKQMWFSSR